MSVNLPIPGFVRSIKFLSQMKKNIFFIFIFIFFGCKSNNQGNEVPIRINTAAVRKYTPKDSLVIVTCTRCNCFVEALNSLTETEKLYISQYPILSDSNCNSLNIPSIFIDRRAIDSISVDIYNITLLKKKANRFDVRIIQLSESREIMNVMKDFFENQ